MNEILEQALPFWESLTDKQKEEIRNNMVKTECQKKTQLHFGGGECAGGRTRGGGGAAFSAVGADSPCRADRACAVRLDAAAKHARSRAG